MDNNIIYLTDENGEDVDFEFLDLIEYEGNEYAVLFPMDENDGEVVILLVEYGENKEIEAYCSIDDEKVLLKVFELFKKRMLSEQENYEEIEEALSELFGE